MQDNLVKEDKPRVFLAFLAKKVLPLEKNATCVPRAISPIKKNKTNANPAKRMNTNREKE
jgi:hypothetical protein